MDGLTVLTGETGAGKSILLGAFQLVLGNRADPDSLRSKNEKCIVEAEFALDNSFKALFKSLDLEYAEPCIIRREINASGRSRAFVNDSPVLLDKLRSLSTHLVDIHSQNDQLLIHDHEFQMDILDMLTEDSKVIEEYEKAWEQWQQAQSALSNFLKELEGISGDPDYLQYLVNELDELSPKDGEISQLEERIELLSNAEQIIQLGNGIIQQIDNSETSPLSALGTIEAELQKLGSKWQKASDYAQRLSVITEGIEDWKRELEDDVSSVELDPSLLAQAEDRLDEYNRILHKHKLDTDHELMEFHSQVEDQLNKLEDSKGKRLELEAAVEEARNFLEAAADKLHEERKKVAQKLGKTLEEIMSGLELEKARLQVAIEKGSELTARGSDLFRWMFTANPGSPFQALEKVASGGELSRVMLAVKSLLAKHRKLPTVLFDEIDSGISGRTAGKIAQVLNELANNLQLIAITHLPQVASAGGQHLKVVKTQTETDTTTSVGYVSEKDRVEEIARLMSSEGVTQAARSQAKELLNIYQRV